MKCHLLLVVIALFSYSSTSNADSLITFSFKPYVLKANAQDPFKATRQTTLASIEKFFSPLIAGIPVSYGGYLTVSDINGIVSLPRLHEKPTLNILITSRITPIVMGGLTIHHWEREEGTASALYNVERIQDPQRKKYEWVVSKKPLPTSMIIKPSTIIIFAEPDSIIVPTGSFPAHDQLNMDLPDIYVKNEIMINQRSLYVMNIKQFFGPLFSIYMKKPSLYQKHILYEKN